MKRFVLTFLFFCICLASFSQTSEEQLAAQYFQNKEYDKALVYYEKIYERTPTSVSYNYYLSCLIATKNFKQAEKLVKKLIKQNPSELQYFVDLGKMYKAAELPDKSKEAFNNGIKQLSPNQQQILDLAQAFMIAKEFDMAIETYKRGRKLLNDGYPFNFELAEAMEAKGDIKAMVQEYLSLLDLSDSYIQQVQNALQLKFGDDQDQKKAEIVKGELLQRIQSDPEKNIYSELLIWILLQQHEYDAAFTQARAMDKRRGEDGTRIMNLAAVCTNSENYDVAIKAYDYVISKGYDKSPQYIKARMEVLNVQYLKLTKQLSSNEQDFLLLDAAYTKTLDYLGKVAATAPLMKSQAHLKAFYLNKSTEAIELLQQAIVLPNLSPPIQAECKLELGDILLMTGDVWEASLTYSQVEKAFKHDAIGQEAKFRNARLSYYLGDFKWAQTQLDVLKASTAKLIANDALDLSVLITENIGLDSNLLPLFLFSGAELCIYQNQEDLAIQKMDSITKLFPGHTLTSYVLYKKASLLLKHNKTEDAIKLYEDIYKNYSDQLLADDALYNEAMLYEKKLNNVEKAKELYQELLTTFPGSLYTVDARKRFRKLRGDAIN